MYDGLNLIVEALKNDDAFLFGVYTPGNTAGSVMALFSSAAYEIGLQVHLQPIVEMGMSTMALSAIDVSYGMMLEISGSDALMTVYRHGIFLEDCPLNIMDIAIPHVLISASGGYENIQTTISFLNPNPASTGPRVLNANVLLLKDA